MNTKNSICGGYLELSNVPSKDALCSKILGTIIDCTGTTRHRCTTIK